MNTLRIGVLMAGTSIEREVGFNTGRTVCDHLDTTRYTVIPIFQKCDGTLYKLPWHFLHRGKISDFEHRLEHEAHKMSWEDVKHAVDLLYIAQHGRYAEDGALQGMLEVLGIPYVGSKVFASALGMNKAVQKEFLRQSGICVPHGIVVEPLDLQKYAQNIELLLQVLRKQGLSFPLIVKPSAEGSSFGVSCVDDEKLLIDALQKAAFIHAEKSQAVLIEEKIEGMEFSCIVLEDYKKHFFV